MIFPVFQRRKTKFLKKGRILPINNFSSSFVDTFPNARQKNIISPMNKIEWRLFNS